MRTRVLMVNGFSPLRSLPGVGALYAGLRAALLIGVVWLGTGADLAGIRSAWGDPVTPGRDQTRCDGDGCSLGACVTKRLWADPAQISGYARAVPRFIDGKQHGFQLYGVRPGTLLVQLGLQNGDIVVSVNGKELSDPATALAAYAECKDAPLITLAIERKGQPLTRHLYFDRGPLLDSDCPPLAKPAESAGDVPAAAAKTAPAVSPVKPAQSQEAALRSIARDITCKTTRCTLRHGVADRILENTTLLASSGRIVPAVQEGKILGFKMYAIRAGSLWALLGLKNGDVVHNVNGYDLSSPEQALEVYSKLRQARELRVSLDREGASLVLEYVIAR